MSFDDDIGGTFATDANLIERLSALGEPTTDLDKLTAPSEVESPLAVEIVVREHGEIGPVLTIKGQDFTGPADI